MAKINGTCTDFNPSELTAHLNSKDMGSNKAKLDRLNISDPYNAPRVIFTTFTSETDNPLTFSIHIFMNTSNLILLFLFSWDGT